MDNLLAKRRAERSASTVDHRSITVFSYRLVVLGRGSVGKTAIIERLLNNKFVDKHHNTIEDLHSRIYRINGVKVHTEILDTAGSFCFPAMRRISITNADAFLIVYSVIDMASFQAIQTIIDEICEIRKNNVHSMPMLIVGNKTDQVDGRQVNAGDVIQWMIKHTGNLQRIKSIEVSAKTDYQVQDAFKEVIRLSGLIEVFASVTKEKISPLSADSHRTRRRFSFSRPFRRSPSNVEMEEEDSSKGAKGTKSKRRLRCSLGGDEEELEHCHVQ